MNREVDMTRSPFVYVTYIKTTPEKLWEALTGGEFTRRYWGGRRIQSDWNVGSPVRHVREDGGIDWEGEVLQAQPPRLLSYTFHMQISEQHRGERPSRVTFELQPMGSVVKLTLTHDDFESGSATFETTRHGWPAIMSSLKSLLETASPLPFQGLGFGPSSKELGRL
jgi:uncharacterized protein YndB with AHSA1/START domain